MTSAPTPTSTAAPWPRFGVEKAGQYLWFVPSKSLPGAYRRVEWHHTPDLGNFCSCSCPAGVAAGQMGTAVGRPCRHVQAVAHAEAADGYKPRPAGRVDPSAFVD